MKHTHFIRLVTVLLLCLPLALQAQIVGANAFMQGTYVEIGVNTCGAYGSGSAPPAGYHPSPFLSGLGFVADSDQDGWDVGTPEYCGDYFVPGSPVEGWQIQIDGNTWTNTDQFCWTSEVPGDMNMPEGSTPLCGKERLPVKILPSDKLPYFRKMPAIL